MASVGEEGGSLGERIELDTVPIYLNIWLYKSYVRFLGYPVEKHLNL